MQYLDFIDGGRMPALGLGTWELEGAGCVDAIRSALEIGYRHIDTAEMYGNEREIGRALAASSVEREEVFLTTKIWWENLRPADLRRSVEASLEKLGGYVDLLLIHWPNPEVPLGDTLAAMEELHAAGKARRLGVSNFPPLLFERACAQAPIVCNQVEFHPLLDQTELLLTVRAQGAVLTAYSPLAHGRVSREPTLEEIGRRHGKSPYQVALRWLLEQERVAAIPRSADRDHQRANFEVFDFALSDEERGQIDRLARGERLIDPPFAPDW